MFPDVRCGISCRPYRKSLSSHMQEIGRVMRPDGADKQAIWLDHSGNIERFGLDMWDVWENGAGELDHAATLDTKPRERKQAKADKPICPECSGALRSNTCLCCGWEKPARSGIVNVEGEMREFDPQAATMEARAGLRAPCLKEPKVVWEACLAYTFERGRGDAAANIKWAKGIFRGIYPGDWPARNWGETPPQIANQHAYALIEREVRNFRKNSKRVAA